MKPITLIVLCGVAVACFIGGRLTAPRHDEHATKHTAAAEDKAIRYASLLGSGNTSTEEPENADASTPQKFASVKSAAELHDELEKLKDPGRSTLTHMKEMARLRERIEASHVEGLIEEFAKESPPPRDTQGLQMLFAVMAEKDPENAWHHAMTLPPAMRNAALLPAIERLASVLPEAALDRIKTIDNPVQQRPLLRAAIGKIAENDPSQAFKLLDSVRGDDALVGIVFNNWAQKDMKAAQRAMEGLDERTKMNALQSIASTMAEIDPAAAWQFATENSPTGGGRLAMEARMQLIGQWARHDPQAALEAAAAITDNTTRNNLFSNAFRSWAGTDYDAAFQHIMNASDPGVVSSGLYALAGVQGCDRTALFNAVLVRIPAGNQFQRTMSQLVDNWSRENPREAAAAVAQLPAGNTFSNAVRQVATQWIERATDKNEPLQWVLSTAEGDTRSGALTSIFNGWAAADPIAAATAAGKLAEEDRTNVISTIASAWSNSDPQAVIRWAASLPFDQRDSAIQATLGTVAGNDPKKALSMLTSLGLNNDPYTVNTIVNQWVNNDIGAASTWVRQLPQGDVRDTSLRTVAQRLSADEPQTAAAWALAISNPASRVSTLESIVRQWKRNDSQAAYDWVVSSNLPEITKNALLR